MIKERLKRVKIGIFLAILTIFLSGCTSGNVTVDLESDPLYDETNFLAGSAVERWIQVTNHTDEAQFVDIWIQNNGGDESEDLLKELNFQFKNGETELYNGKLFDLLNNKIHEELTETGTVEYKAIVSLNNNIPDNLPGTTAKFTFYVGYNGSNYKVTEVNTVTVAAGSEYLPGSFTLSNENPVCDTNYPEGPAVRLNWTESSEATSYHVYRNGSLYENATTDLTFYNSVNVTAGQTYEYYIQARNENGDTNSNTIGIYVPSNVCDGSQCSDGKDNDEDGLVDYPNDPGCENAEDDAENDELDILDIERVSVASDGTEGNGYSGSPSVSMDGRYIAFRSEASNLISGDINSAGDIFVHDRQTGQTTRISVASDGTQGNLESYNLSISANGRYVAFDSFAQNLVSDDTNSNVDIFIHDRTTRETIRVSVASDGTQGDNWSSYPAISADGNHIVFVSRASNLVSGGANGREHIFIYDRETGQTTRSSVASDGTQGNYSSDHPAISANGRYVTFRSQSTNLVSDDTNGTRDVFVHDCYTDQTTRISVSFDGTQGDSESNFSTISANGRYVAFDSFAQNLVSDDTNGTIDTFVHDRQTGQTTRISVASDGTQGNNYSYFPNISADGRYIAFRSEASNLISGDINSAGDIFVHDRQTGQTTRISVASDGTQGDNWSSCPAISADGNHIVFVSSASNLVPNDTNNKSDIFVATNPLCDGIPLTNHAPVITLLGDSPMTVTLGDTFIDPRATASDAEDDMISDMIQVSGTVDTSTLGTYTLNYNVTDSQNLAAEQKTRTVIVSSQCSDGEDNDGDKLVDKNDPGCHTDGDATNNDSYDPKLDNENLRILSVPYYSQGDTDWCVLTSMSMIFKYYGANIHSWNIAKSWNLGRDEAFDGKSTIKNYFKNKEENGELELGAEDIAINFNKIKEAIDSGKPVLLVMHHFDFPFYDEGKADHAIVVTGYKIVGKDKALYINDSGNILNSELHIGQGRSVISREVNWNDLDYYLGTYTYAIAVDGEPNPPKGTIDINTLGMGLLFYEEKQARSIESYAYGKNQGIGWKHNEQLHSLELTNNDVVEFDQYVTNHTNSTQEYKLKVDFIDIQSSINTGKLIEFTQEEIATVDKYHSKNDFMSPKNIQDILINNYGEYTIILTLWGGDDFSEQYDKIIFPKIRYEMGHLTQPTYDASCPSGEEVDNLVIITHGWNSSSEADWIINMENSIKKQIKNKKLSGELNANETWEVCIYDWKDDANTGIYAWNAYVNAISQGELLGKRISLAGSKNMHLLAHSAGSNLIQYAVNQIRGYRNFYNPQIHMTFFDSYDLYAYDKLPDVSQYGNGATWAEQYVHMGILPYTNNVFAHTYNFNISDLVTENDDGGHGWPNIWYNRSINNPIKYGFPFSIESGLENLPLEYTPGDKCDLTLENQECITNKAQIYETKTNYDENILDILNAQNNGYLEVSDMGNLTMPVSTVAIMETSSPIWFKVLVNTENPVNVLRFDYEFISDEDSEGILAVSVDDKYVYKIDERTTESGTHSANDIWIGNVNHGLHSILFKLESFTNVHSKLKISNVQFGLLKGYKNGLPLNSVNMETQISVTKMEYGGEDILNAVTADVGDNQAPLLLSELKESSVNLKDYVQNSELNHGQKKKLKMKFKFLESASNEYQGKSINASFKFLAT